MPELICHLFGDYILQSHVMATRKPTSSFWAAVHVGFYMLPFLFLTGDWRALAVIGGTHFLIDRFRLAGYWVRFWGIGVPGTIPTDFHRRNREDSPLFDEEYDHRYPLPDPAPPWLCGMLAIVVDNTFHLTINHLALMI